MGSGDGQITVSYPQLDQTGKDIDSAAKAIDRQLADLDRYVTQLHINWQGNAFDAYQRAHQGWMSAMHDLNQTLADTVTALSGGTVTYRTAEQNVINSWF